MSINQIPIIVDLERSYRDMRVKVTQNTDVAFKVTILKAGQPVSLPDGNTFTLTTKNSLGQSYFAPLPGVPDGNTIVFKLGSQQVSEMGLIRASIQIMNVDERVDSLPFTFTVLSDLTKAAMESGEDSSLIEMVLFDGARIIQEAGDTVEYTREQGDLAAAIVVTTEAERANTEAVRIATESERLATEVVRNETIAVKDATETERLSIDAVRIATESERLATESERIATETVREDTLTAKDDYLVVRESVIAERQLSEENRSNLTGRMTTVEGVATTAKETADLAKARADLIIGQAGTSNTEIVDSRLGADLVARATSGTLIREIHANQLETARQTTTLVNGVSVVTGGVDALAETEIEGRTLISLANSNLDATKKYVLADKKTKVVVDNVTQSGVAKFTKGTTTVSTANFVGKAYQSTIVNPHKTGVVLNTTTLVPPPSVENIGTNDILKMSSLGGEIYTYFTNSNGAIMQQKFSFDIIAEIERKLGIIPKSTLAEKRQWVIDNVETMLANWHGFGSSAGGNKAKFTTYNNLLGGSYYGGTTHTNGTVTKLTQSLAFANNVEVIDANGFAHFLAYADPSDGVTASSISTDYIDLVVTLKATAQLNTRPTIIRVENFEGKVAGSVVENPHVAKRMDSGGLVSISAWANVLEDTASTGLIQKLDGLTTGKSSSLSGKQSQHLFSFNLIEAVERNVGKIPRTSVADKVQWIKDNVANMIPNWYGFGSSVGGNKAGLSLWNNSAGTWIANWISNASSAPTKTFNNVSTAAIASGNYIDANGFIHFLAYAEPSDGVTASTINTDYIDLEIELKPTADFTRPKVALYEVPATDYAKILVDWNADEVVNRYPVVEGVQHIQGVGVIAEGENLLPPFTEWTLHANAKVISQYELELNATAISQPSTILVNVVPNQPYNISSIVGADTSHRLTVYKKDGSTSIANLSSSGDITFTPTENQVLINVRNYPASSGTFTFKQPMLTLGSVAKPFVPRNLSYLYADVKLGAIGTVADRLYEQDGAKFVRKVVEKDVVLDGSLAWTHGNDYVGFKRFAFILATAGANGTQQVTKYNGDNIKKVLTWTQSDFSNLVNTAFEITTSDIDTGFGETFIPINAEIKAYFYGWKMNNGVFGTNYDGAGTKTWIPIGDTTNARAVTVVPTSPSPTQLDGTIQPYKLSYVLATPQIVNVTDKVEGQLKVNGLTQVEAMSGIVRREKVTPLSNGVRYYLNEGTLPGSLAKNKVYKFIEIYKNGIKDLSWTKDFVSGVPRLFNPGNSFFDPTAEYTVTYLALDKPTLTANPTNIKLLYANNMRSSLEDAVGVIQNNTTQLSVHEKSIVDLYVRVKALEVKV